jgi:hypothetical protein
MVNNIYSTESNTFVSPIMLAVEGRGKMRSIGVMMALYDQSNRETGDMSHNRAHCSCS